MFQNWINLYKQMQEPTFKKGELVCPECGSHSVDFQYVGDEVERIGYLDIWCSTCKNGVHFSRVSIPEGVDFISFDEPDEIVVGRIPDFKQVAPSTLYPIVSEHERFRSAAAQGAPNQYYVSVLPEADNAGAPPAGALVQPEAPVFVPMQEIFPDSSKDSE